MHDVSSDLIKSRETSMIRQECPVDDSRGVAGTKSLSKSENSDMIKVDQRSSIEDTELTDSAKYSTAKIIKKYIVQSVELGVGNITNLDVITKPDEKLLV